MFGRIFRNLLCYGILRKGAAAESNYGDACGKDQAAGKARSGMECAWHRI
jgi:hypothetical protein